MQFDPQKVDVQVPMQPGWHNNSPRKRAFWGCKQNFKTYNPPAGGIVRIEKRVEPTSLEENPVLVRDFSGRFNTSYSGDFKSPKLAGKKRVFVPSFEALDKKVLRWYGYYREAIEESQVERERLRLVTFMYYLIDDTLEVVEPKQTNSGLSQGGLLNRHQVPKPEGGFLTWKDIVIGSDLDLYKRVYRVIDADDYTRRYTAERGYELAPAESLPENIDTSWKAFVPLWLQEKVQDRDFKLYCEALLGKTWHDSERLKRFIEFNGMILKFSCYWDDQASENGDINDYTILFYLEDNSMQIVEVRQPNSGKFYFCTLFKRNKLMKNWDKQFFKARAPNKDDKVYYEIKDMKIGNTLNAFGRDLIITGCDGATRKWFEQNQDLVGFTQPPNNTRKDIIKPWPKSEPPAYNGLGTEEDSLNSCKSLMPKPPRKDHVKWNKYEGKVLKYKARMVSNPERELIIVYYLQDDTLRVFELATPNSGFPGGNFLRRQKYRKDPKDYSLPFITYRDLAVGSILEINRYKLEMYTCDIATEALEKELDYD
eukprot:g502.t1